MGAVMEWPSGVPDGMLNVDGGAGVSGGNSELGAIEPGAVMVWSRRLEVGMLNVLGRVGTSVTVIVSQVVLVDVVVVVDVLSSPDWATARGNWCSMAADAMPAAASAMMEVAQRIGSCM